MFLYSWYMEIWKDVVGQEGKYKVSNQNGFYNVTLKKEFKGGISHGYRYVTMGRKNKNFFHIIVAQAFPEICGEWFEGCAVHHKNFNRMDNRPENLIVLTHSEHSKLHYEHQPDTFKQPSEKRSKSISKALTGRRATYKHVPIVQLTKNGDFVKNWECISDVEKELGYSASNICSCCKGQLKTAYGFLWQYAVNN